MMPMYSSRSGSRMSDQRSRSVDANPPIDDSGVIGWHRGEIAARVIDEPFIDAVEKAEKERKEREALEWAAAEMVAADDDMKGDD